jgi:hypothetical protein
VIRQKIWARAPLENALRFDAQLAVNAQKVAL